MFQVVLRWTTVLQFKIGLRIPTYSSGPRKTRLILYFGEFSWIVQWRGSDDRYCLFKASITISWTYVKHNASNYIDMQNIAYMSEYKTYTIVNIRIGPGFSHDFVQIAGIFQRRCEMERGSFLLNFRFKKMNYFIEYYLIHSINRLWVVSDQIFCYIRSFKNDSLKWKLKKNII